MVSHKLYRALSTPIRGALSNMAVFWHRDLDRARLNFMKDLFIKESGQIILFCFAKVGVVRKIKSLAMAAGFSDSSLK